MTDEEVEETIKVLIKEFKVFRREYSRPSDLCKSITKREVAQFVLYKIGQISKNLIFADKVSEGKQE